MSAISSMQWILIPTTHQHGLSWHTPTHHLDPTWEMRPELRCSPRARAAIARAHEIDPDLAEAHTVLAWMRLWHDWDWSGAEQEFQRSLALNPNDSVTIEFAL